jgi:hypothetical protein
LRLVKDPIVGKITGHFSPIVPPFPARGLSRRCRRGGAWGCKWELPKHRVSTISLQAAVYSWGGSRRGQSYRRSQEFNKPYMHVGNKSNLLWTVLKKRRKHLYSCNRKSNLIYFKLNSMSLFAVIAIFPSHAYASCDVLNTHRLLFNIRFHTCNFTTTQPKFGFRDGSWMISNI